MPQPQPYPEFDELLKMIGEAGERITEINASEGAAGNLSMFIGWQLEPRRRFPLTETIELPTPAPDLAGGAILMTGSGRRLREIKNEPELHLGIVLIQPGGERAILHTAPGRRYERLSSEFNSHIAIHQDQVRQTGTNFHAVIHAQPRHLTYLSHIPQYRDEDLLNRRLLRWQPELIVNLPEGIGLVPFYVPGSAALMRHTVEALRRCRIVVWSKHGVVARSDVSIKRAADRIEYAEAAAHYEYLDLANNRMADGLSPEEIRAICQAWNIDQKLF
jgi:rhamnulose-1-phosphate aldolase